MSAWVWLARIRRPQGRKGEVFAEILTDFPEKFAERKQLWLLRVTSGAGDSSDPRCVELENHWPHKSGGQSGIVLHFAGVASISDAEKLNGLIVALPAEERAMLGEDEVHIADLIGCELVDVGGPGPNPEAVVVGRIENVDRSAGPSTADAVPLLIVRGERGEVLVPFAKSFLRKLDLVGKRVEMALPKGLVELNG